MLFFWKSKFPSFPNRYQLYFSICQIHFFVLIFNFDRISFPSPCFHWTKWINVSYFYHSKLLTILLSDAFRETTNPSWRKVDKFFAKSSRHTFVFFVWDVKEDTFLCHSFFSTAVFSRITINKTLRHGTRLRCGQLPPPSIIMPTIYWINCSPFFLSSF